MKSMGIFTALSVLLTALIISCRIIWKRHSEKEFFRSIRLIGYDGQLPKYRGQYAVNTFIKRIRFKSKIPPNVWEKAKPDIEMFYNKKVYKIEPKEKDLRTINIFLIKEQLPNYIEWKDDSVVDGRRFAIGESYSGTVIWDCTNRPHGLIAGATNSGKSALLRCIIHQAIFKKWNVSVLDFKCGGDYASIEREYQDITRDYGPIVISEPEEARNILVALLVEVRGRLKEFKKAGVTNIDEFNARGREQFLPWLIVVDEAAEVLDVKPKDKREKELYIEIEQKLRTLARISRAAGVHILISYIRPSSDVLDGQIKNNLLWRACGYFADPAASRIVLDNDKATELPPEIKGRFIVIDEETQVYYLPIHSDSSEGSNLTDDGGSGGEAERKPPEPPTAEGSAT